MRISRILALSGPNVWSRAPVLEIWLQSTVAAEERSPAGCRERVRLWLSDAGLDVPACGDLPDRAPPVMAGNLAVGGSSTACGNGVLARQRPAFVPSDAGGNASPVVLFAELAQQLQTLAATSVSRFWIEAGPSLESAGQVPSEAGRTWLSDDALDAGPAGIIRVVLESVEEPVAQLAVRFAHEIVWGATDDLPPVRDWIDALHECANAACFGATTGPVVEAARARGIPVTRLDGDCLLQFGYGARHTRVQGVVTSRSGFLAEAVSRDKLLTKRLLEKLRLPTARGRLAADAEDAWSAAVEIGLPVVVKPRDADYGNGVSVRLTTKAELTEAWKLARAVRSEVLVEQHLAGVPHRLFVVSGRLVGAARRDPALVVGDGERTVGELIAEANRDPRRGDGPDAPWYPITADDALLAALERQGLGLSSVPAPGRSVVLQKNPHGCRAETIRDVTDLVHADVAAAAIDAVRLTGLDVAGVDVMAEDISRPLDEQGGGILEVNAGPAIYLHRHPMCSPGRPVVEAVVDSLIPPGETGRIPIVAVAGDDAAAVAGEIAKLLRPDGFCVGLSTRAGIAVGGRTLSRTRAGDAGGCRALLLHPAVDLAICELSLSSVRNEGLPFDRCDIVVLTGRNRLAQSDAGPEDAGWVERSEAHHAACQWASHGSTHPTRLLVESATASDSGNGWLIANVDDSEVAAQVTAGDQRLLAVATEREHSFLAEHRRLGGAIAFLDGDQAIIESDRPIGARQALSMPPDLTTSASALPRLLAITAARALHS